MYALLTKREVKITWILDKFFLQFYGPRQSRGL